VYLLLYRWAVRSTMTVIWPTPVPTARRWLVDTSCQSSSLVVRSLRVPTWLIYTLTPARCLSMDLALTALDYCNSTRWLRSTSTRPVRLTARCLSVCLSVQSFSTLFFCGSRYFNTTFSYVHCLNVQCWWRPYGVVCHYQCQSVCTC